MARHAFGMVICPRCGKRRAAPPPGVDARFVCYRGHDPVEMQPSARRGGPKRPHVDPPVNVRAAALNEKQAAAYLNFSLSYLRQARYKRAKGSPPFVRLGRAVRYLVKDLDAWLAAGRVTSST